ncbi:unnamed protein product [Caenorhabditis sp. 36 PRJEB53466]|nr:unnamed protein product [Caenorhabditis sp. 36 PRJEB53466]
MWFTAQCIILYAHFGVRGKLLRGLEIRPDCEQRALSVRYPYNTHDAEIAACTFRLPLRRLADFGIHCLLSHDFESRGKKIEAYGRYGFSIITRNIIFLFTVLAHLFSTISTIHFDHIFKKRALVIHRLNLWLLRRSHEAEKLISRTR